MFAESEAIPANMLHSRTGPPSTLQSRQRGLGADPADGDRSLGATSRNAMLQDRRPPGFPDFGASARARLQSGTPTE
jgi:hypothetical protein